MLEHSFYMPVLCTATEHEYPIFFWSVVLGLGFTVQDVLEYLPDSAHALGWQEEGVAERWYAAGPGATPPAK